MELVQQISPAFALNCCGQRTDLPARFRDEVNLYRSEFGGDENKAVIKSWTSSSLLEVNKSLKSGINLESCGAYVWRLTEAIKSRCSSHGKPRGLLYRGSAVPPDFLNNFRNNGSTFMFPTFLSATKDRRVAEDFASTAARLFEGSYGAVIKIVLVIDCDNEVGESYYADISDCSVYQDEQETVFVPYTGFEVMGCCVSGDFWHVTVRPCDQKALAQRAERFAWHPGSTGVPERSLLYDQNCCGKRRDLQGDFASEVAQHKRGLGYDEDDALLRSYTTQQPNGVPYTSLYTQANIALKTNAKLESHGGYIWALKQAIKRRFAKGDKPTGLLFRGVAAPKTEEVLGILQTPGRKFVFPAFTSASNDEEEARRFASQAYSDGPGKQRVLLKIHTDAEIGLTYYVDIRDISAFPKEKETLFFPYSGFEVMGSSWDGDFLIVDLRPYDQQMICSEHAV